MSVQCWAHQEMPSVCCPCELCQTESPTHCTVLGCCVRCSTGSTKLFCIRATCSAVQSIQGSAWQCSSLLSLLCASSVLNYTVHSQTAVWECPPAERHLIIPRMLRHALSRHLAVPEDCVSVTSGQLDTALLEGGRGESPGCTALARQPHLVLISIIVLSLCYVVTH